MVEQARRDKREEGCGLLLHADFGIWSPGRGPRKALFVYLNVLWRGGAGLWIDGVGGRHWIEEGRGRLVGDA